MLSSAAIATAAALGMNTDSSSRSQDSDFDINELVRRLQILTRVDYVSSSHLLLDILCDFCIFLAGLTLLSINIATHKASVI